MDFRKCKSHTTCILIKKLQNIKKRNTKTQRKGEIFMQIDDMGQTLELLNNINYFFKNIEEIAKELQAELYNKEGERDDLLHEIELSYLNIGERASIYKKLKTVLQERRVIKDKIDLINTIKPYESKFITKGICAETDATIKNIETLRNNQENRKYTPRILKNLKCAKRYEEL